MNLGVYFIKSSAILAHVPPKTKQNIALVGLYGRNNVQFAQPRLFFGGETIIVSNEQATICQW